MPSGTPRLLPALLVLAALAAPPAAVAQNPLVGQWHLDEQYEVDENDTESPDGTPDSSGGGRDLVGCNACIFLQPGGRFGNHQPTASIKPLNTATGIRPQRVTLIAWVRRNTFPANDEVIAGQVSGQVTCDGMSYALTHRGGVSDAGVDFAIRQPGGTFVATPTDTNVDDGDWHMLAGTFDGSSVRLFIDGVHVGSTPTPAAAIEYTSASAAFGIDGYTDPCVTPDYQGDLDEIRVYDRALSATEIARLASPAATTPPVLVPDVGPPPPAGSDCPAGTSAGVTCQTSGGVTTAVGTPGSDTIDCREIKGLCSGGSGDDRLDCKGKKGEKCAGGSGRDILDCRNGEATCSAGSGNDKLNCSGDKKSAECAGEGGKDTLDCRNGAAKCSGGSEKDKLNCSGDKKSAECAGNGGKDTLDCRNGAATCSGGSDKDKLNCSTDKKSAECAGNGGKDTLDCRNGAATCSGGSDKDRLNCSGDKKSAECAGEGGKDTLDCRNGAATCSGGSSNDKLDCRGDKSKALCSGGGGADTLNCSTGLARCAGGPGTDSVRENDRLRENASR